MVGMVALTTASHPQGSVLQAILVFLFVGVLPMGLAHYILGHGARRRKRLLEEQRAKLDELGKTGEVPADVLARVIKAAYDL